MLVPSRTYGKPKNVKKKRKKRSVGLPLTSYSTDQSQPSIFNSDESLIDEYWQDPFDRIVGDKNDLRKKILLKEVVHAEYNRDSSFDCSMILKSTGLTPRMKGNVGCTISTPLDCREQSRMPDCRDSSIGLARRVLEFFPVRKRKNRLRYTPELSLCTDSSLLSENRSVLTNKNHCGFDATKSCKSIVEEPTRTKRQRKENIPEPSGTCPQVRSCYVQLQKSLPNGEDFRSNDSHQLRQITVSDESLTGPVACTVLDEVSQRLQGLEEGKSLEINFVRNIEYLEARSDLSYVTKTSKCLEQSSKSKNDRISDDKNILIARRSRKNTKRSSRKASSASKTKENKTIQCPSESTVTISQERDETASRLSGETTAKVIQAQATLGLEGRNESIEASQLVMPCYVPLQRSQHNKKNDSNEHRKRRHQRIEKTNSAPPLNSSLEMFKKRTGGSNALNKSFDENKRKTRLLRSCRQASGKSLKSTNSRSDPTILGKLSDAATTVNQKMTSSLRSRRELCGNGRSLKSTNSQSSTANVEEMLVPGIEMNKKTTESLREGTDHEKSSHSGISSDFVGELSSQARDLKQKTARSLRSRREDGGHEKSLELNTNSGRSSENVQKLLGQPIEMKGNATRLVRSHQEGVDLEKSLELTISFGSNVEIAGELLDAALEMKQKARTRTLPSRREGGDHVKSSELINSRTSVPIFDGRIRRECLTRSSVNKTNQTRRQVITGEQNVNRLSRKETIVEANIADKIKIDDEPISRVTRGSKPLRSTSRKTNNSGRSTQNYDSNATISGDKTLPNVRTSAGPINERVPETTDSPIPTKRSLRNLRARNKTEKLSTPRLSRKTRRNLRQKQSEIREIEDCEVQVNPTVEEVVISEKTIENAAMETMESSTGDKTNESRTRRCFVKLRCTKKNDFGRHKPPAANLAHPAPAAESSGLKVRNHVQTPLKKRPPKIALSKTKRKNFSPQIPRPTRTTRLNARTRLADQNVVATVRKEAVQLPTNEETDGTSIIAENIEILNNLRFGLSESAQPIREEDAGIYANKPNCDLEDSKTTIVEPGLENDLDSRKNPDKSADRTVQISNEVTIISPTRYDNNSSCSILANSINEQSSNLQCNSSKETTLKTTRTSLNDSIDRDCFITAITQNAKVLNLTSFQNKSRLQNLSNSLHNSKNHSFNIGSVSATPLSLLGKTVHENSEYTMIDESFNGQSSLNICLAPGKWRKSLNRWRRNVSINLDKTIASNSSGINKSSNSQQQNHQPTTNSSFMLVSQQNKENCCNVLQDSYNTANTSIVIGRNSRVKSKNGSFVPTLSSVILESSLVEVDQREDSDLLLLEPTDDGTPNLPSLSLLESAIGRNLQSSLSAFHQQQKSVVCVDPPEKGTARSRRTSSSSNKSFNFNETSSNEPRHPYQHQLSVPLFRQPSIPRRRRTSVIARCEELIAEGPVGNQLISDFVYIPYEKSIRTKLSPREILLRRCNQSEPLDFSTVYSDIVLKQCRKIGEGVYGEVYMNKTVRGDAVVLKIIPIEGPIEINGEAQKNYDQILPEIVIAMELSRLRNDKQFMTSGFVEINKVCCVQGPYPEHLIERWELYRDNSGSENDHPEIFPDDQLYIVFEQTYGGQDLEAFTFQNALQSYSAFVQTALTLAIAEQKFQFEHRDLHWGNILLAPIDDEEIVFCVNGEEIKVASHGVKVTIIDFTLSRMVYDDCCLYNDLANDNELFSASGDYQFDIYRFMKQRLNNQWTQFEPYTNILWLHYTIDKMISGARYRCSKSKKHRSAINVLMQLRDELLDFKSASDYVECLK